MRYTKAMDLGTFDCVPQHVAFVPIGKFLVYSRLYMYAIMSIW